MVDATNIVTANGGASGAIPDLGHAKPIPTNQANPADAKHFHHVMQGSGAPQNVKMHTTAHATEMHPVLDKFSAYGKSMNDGLADLEDIEQAVRASIGSNDVVGTMALTSIASTKATQVFSYMHLANTGVSATISTAHSVLNRHD
jgi:hypothetical protein